jgi:hypothetical protein
MLSYYLRYSYLYYAPKIFARYTMVIEDSSPIVHVITFEHYPWLAMDGLACQILIFKLQCSKSRIISTVVVSSIISSLLIFLALDHQQMTILHKQNITISVFLVVASVDHHALIITTMQFMLE